MDRIRTIFKLQQRHAFIILAVAVILGILMLYFWLRQSPEVSHLQLQHQEVLCTVWRTKVTLQLASLRTKFITNRDNYLFQNYTRLENSMKAELANCSEHLESYHPRPFKRSLEALAIQLLQRDELALDTINDLETMFAP